MKARELTRDQVNRLDNLWKKDPDATLEDLDRPDIEEEPDLKPTETTYEDGFHYQNVLAPLIKTEADYDKSIKESLSEERVSLRWDKSLKGNYVATFTFGRDCSESRVMVGDELNLKLSQGGIFLNGGKEWEAKGYVKYIEDGDIELELSTSHVPTSVTNDYVVEFVWKSTSFDRMQNALKTFAIDDASVSGYIYHSMLGHAVEEQELDTKLPVNFDAPGLPSLNDSQKNALSKVLRAPFSLIQGPPGTGKTVTSATLVYHLSKQRVGQVLVTAPSNIAVDQLTEKIAKTGLKVVRLCSKTREQITSLAVDSLSLHVMLPEVAGKDFKKLQQLKDEMGELSARDERRYRNLKYKSERLILQSADVICTTCVMAGDTRLNNFRFRQVLIDEATQAVEAEALIPVTLGCKQLVLVGDHMQLPPVVICKQAAKAGLTRSLFERLVVAGFRPVRLAVQYRMHPALAEFPSNMFYEGSLANGVSEEDRTPDGENFPFPSSKPMLFYHCPGGIEEISASGTSYLNRTEASYLEKVVSYLLKLGVKGEDIGVVTPYDGQKVFVTDFVRRSGSLASSLYENIEIASVDSFQGREKDYIIMTCVRSSETGGIGFLADPRRLNVAITRARLGLFVIGNARVLSKNLLWSAMLLSFRDNKSLVEGPLNNLTESSILLMKPKTRKQDQEKYLHTALGRGQWRGKWDGDEVKSSRSGNRRTMSRRRGREAGMDSRHDKKYDNVGNSGGHDQGNNQQAAEIANFAPLPSFVGCESLGYPRDDDSSSVSSSYTSSSSSVSSSLGGARPYTQQTASSQNTSAYMGTQGDSQFSQSSAGYGDYYYDSQSYSQTSLGFNDDASLNGSSSSSVSGGVGGHGNSGAIGQFEDIGRSNVIINDNLDGGNVPKAGQEGITNADLGFNLPPPPPTNLPGEGIDDRFKNINIS